MDAVDEVKHRLNIEDVIGEYVELKRAGRNFKGMSPFVAEKTASFMVSPDKQIWHDFSSGKGGNMFSFIMEMEGVEFRGALELLARKAGVDLEQYGRGDGKTRQLKDRLYEANEWACKFYQKQLVANKTALEYLMKKRAYTRETLLLFRLGYSPNTNGRSLSEFLMKKGFTADELKKAGLATQRRNGLGDMFRGRIMVPLMDPQGKVVGFTARLLIDDPEAPKYINTPQTLLYDKGRHVFGLHLAKEALRKEKFAVLTEGNLDVIASHQAGVAQVVATAGTALTEMQLKALGRFTPDIRLAFDQDKAGLAATERAIPIAQKVGVQLSVVTIPEGKDPDELVKSNPQSWRDVITKPEHAVDWLMARYAEQLDVSTAQGKKKLSDVALATIRRLDDPVEQEHYVRHLAEITGSSETALQKKLQGIPEPSSTVRRNTKPRTAEGTNAPAGHGAQAIVMPPLLERWLNHVLAIALSYPACRLKLVELPPIMFEEPDRKAVYDFVIANPGGNDKDAIAKELHTQEDYVKILVLQFEELYQDLASDEVMNAFHTLLRRAVHDYVKYEKAKLQLTRQSADDATKRQLEEQDKQMNLLLNKYKD